MNFVFVSNYFTHHQKPFCDAMHMATKGRFTFIETESMSEERRRMGWGDINKPEYVKELSYRSAVGKKEICQILNNADVVIQGTIHDNLIFKRLRKGKLTFIYTERLYKSTRRYLKLPIHLLKGIILRKAYILCAGGYVARDYSITRSNMGKMYKWGYFPEHIEYDSIDDLISKKNNNSIIWAGRFIDWKHPDLPILVAKRLKEDGRSFVMNIIGTGPMEGLLRDLVDTYGLKESVHLLGAKSPEEVRQYMEKSEIHLFTSDQNEGWGAVLNESMNSGCAVVANCMIGSVPFLIQDGINGVLYSNGDYEELYEKVVYLMDNPSQRKQISKKAYQTIVQEWNANIAAHSFLQLCNALLNGDKSLIKDSEICSPAQII